MAGKKRDIFNELVEGVEAMREHRKGKMTLRTYESSRAPMPRADASVVRETRAALNMSQSVFSSFLQINRRTLENWEQGRTAPNEQANVLIQLARHFPDTLERIDHIVRTEGRAGRKTTKAAK